MSTIREKYGFLFNYYTWLIVGLFVLGFFLYKIAFDLDDRRIAKEENIKQLTATAETGWIYSINEPDKTFTLDPDLDEISGLSWDNEMEGLLAVQDENGYVYHLNARNGEILRKVSFGRDKDYEGLEKVGERIYVVNSNGNIHILSTDDADEDEYSSQIIETKLGSNFDVEGLGWHGGLKRLLMACKKKGDEEDRNRPIYAFDVEDLELSEKPVYVIDSKELWEMEGKNSKEKVFEPSAICVNETEQEIYLISSTAHLFLVMDMEFKPKHCFPLSQDLHQQPEGIALRPDGTLYIANEGRSGLAEVHVYYPK